jgi:hypothetical protein
MTMEYLMLYPSCASICYGLALYAKLVKPNPSSGMDYFHIFSAQKLVKVLINDFLTTKDLFSVLSRGEDSYGQEEGLRSLRDFVDHMSKTLQMAIYEP